MKLPGCNRHQHHLCQAPCSGLLLQVFSQIDACKRVAGDWKDRRPRFWEVLGNAGFGATDKILGGGKSGGRTSV